MFTSILLGVCGNTYCILFTSIHVCRSMWEWIATYVHTSAICVYIWMYTYVHIMMHLYMKTCNYYVHIYKLLCRHYYEVMCALLSLQDNTIYHEDKNFILQNPENKRGSATVEDSEFLLFIAT